MRILFSFVLVCLLGWANGAIASTVHGTYTLLGGIRWQAAYVITNDGEAAPVNEFTIYFPETDYANLTLKGSAAGWDPLVIQPDMGIPAAGFLDGLATDAGSSLGTGQSTSGWLLEFDFLGAGSIGPLRFEIFDEGFNLLSEGLSTVELVGAPPATLPEPGSLGLLAMAACIGAASTRRRGALRSCPVRHRLN